MVSKRREVKLERHCAETLGCLQSPVYTRSTSSALCLFLFLAVMGSLPAVPALTPTEEWCSSALSLTASAFRAESVCLQKWLTPALPLNHPGRGGRLEALKCSVALPGPQISPCWLDLYGISWAVFLFCFICFPQHSLLWIGVRTFPFALRSRSLQHCWSTAETLGFRRTECYGLF